MQFFHYLCTLIWKSIQKNMYKAIRQFFVFAVAVLAATSCVTQKQLTYLRDAYAAKADSINASYTPKREVVIQKGDKMTITVNALDREAVTPYNMIAIATSVPGSTAAQASPMLQYYTVDDAGDIEMPILGKLHVAGLTTSGAEQLVKERLEQQVLSPQVQVNMIGTKVMVLGEVKSPRQVTISDRLTILEALALAGDLTNYGRRDNVLVTREVDGKIEFGRVDLGSADLFTSPYYFLQQNDVVYVAPNKVRAVSSTNAGIWISLAGTIASTAAVIVTVVLNVDKSKTN